jgi:hypothetical protein
MMLVDTDATMSAFVSGAPPAGEKSRRRMRGIDLEFIYSKSWNRWHGSYSLNPPGPAFIVDAT